MNPSAPPRDRRHFEEERPSPLLRFGTAVGLAALAALVCVLPATMRIAAVTAGSEGAPRVSIALSAVVLGPMLASVIVLRGAREGLRAYAGEGVELRTFGVALWLASLVVALSIFGSALRATTHQHALAGVTFAFGALFIAVASALACARVVALLRRASSPVRRAVAGALVLVASLALAWVALRFARAASHDPASANDAAMVVDVLAFALAAGFASRPSFATRRALALVGPPIAVTIAALGFSALRDAPLRTAINEHAPAFAAAADILPGI